MIPYIMSNVIVNDISGYYYERDFKKRATTFFMLSGYISALIYYIVFLNVDIFVLYYSIGRVYSNRVLFLYMAQKKNESYTI